MTRTKQAARRRKREDDAEEYNSDGGFVVDEDTENAPKAKKSKTSTKAAAAPKAAVELGMQKDDNGDEFWEISGKRRVTISTFKGKSMVNIREYYEAGGKMLPGKKGITMSIEQYNAVVELLPEIETVLTGRGEKVLRPKYGGNAGTVPKDDADEVSEAGNQLDSKKNFEATSDEDNED
ncbi:hypothetical protein H2201_002031 [Coniosporium apollinis]|uniref:Transcriptional coactivator p15 (PC4) C-terminal domain-containing protein n=2 Tax=Coniosporium TaxID=2810619 RepID=A0ABQ9NZQ9_9PEZI|nr:hypothetical protein H2199_000865 [Cladosporium sp. JES 115]KAJ9667845.1 hypothetical protein H2201_002031 [Coniosporium apollinis]